MDIRYAERYEGLYRTHWWWRAREQLVVSVLLALRPASGWENVLDIGCGNGLFFDKLVALGAVNVEGVESDPAVVDERGRWRSAIRIGDFDGSFDAASSYDLILMLDVLEHMPSPCSSLATACSLLKPNGRLVITVPAHRGLWTCHDELNHHFTRYTKNALKRAVETAGGAIRYQRYFFHWLALAKVAVKTVEKLTFTEPVSVRTPPVPLNQFFYWLSTREQRIAWTRMLPFGSSLLAVVSTAAN